MPNLEVISAQQGLSKDPTKLKIAVETNAEPGTLLFLVFAVDELKQVTARDALLQTIGNYIIDIAAIPAGVYTMYIMGQTESYASFSFIRD